MGKNLVDIHCHYFNGKFAFRELLEIGWRKMNGDYPYSRDEQKALEEFIPLPSKLGALVEYVASLFSTLIRNAKKNYTYEQDCYDHSLACTSQPLITSPLMMDIYFVADDGSSLSTKKFTEELPVSLRRQAIAPLSVISEDRERFEKFAEDLRQQVINVVKKKRTETGILLEGIDTKLEDVEQALASVIEEFKIPGIEESIDDGKEGLVQLTRGFRKHLSELKKLKKKYPKTVFPFLAVDPRRIGIAQLLEDHLQQDSFAGVKLYPPQGYFPTHPELYPIYDLCLKYNVPITTHTSPGGFHSFRKKIKTMTCDRYGNIEEKDVIIGKGYDLSVCTAENCHFFADPQYWLEILENEKYQDLRINFAHFGGEEQVLEYAKGTAEKNNWTSKIIQMIERFDNVYTDISYCTNPDIVGKIEQIISRHNTVADRLLFGTDFVMIMMDYELTGEQNKALEDYFNHFKTLPQPIFSENPYRFLGIK